MAENEDIPDQEDFTDPSPNPAQDLNLAGLCDVFERHGIKEIVVRYDGCGDSGAVEHVDYIPPGTRIPEALDKQLQVLAEEYCPEGYANDDGGYGTLTIYPSEGLAQLEHWDRFEDTEEMDSASPDLPDAPRARLIQLGVTSITSHFDGCGDSGLIEELSVTPDTITLDKPLADELEEFLLNSLSGGWEINEGSFGDFTIDVLTGEVTTNAYWRVATESDTQTTRWKVRQEWPIPTIIR